jgi:predicted deacylase
MNIIPKRPFLKENIPMELVIGEQTVQRGQRSIFRLNVTEDLDGSNVQLVVHVVSGRRPGPTLALLSAIHGDDWQGNDVIRQVLETVDPEKMTGNVIALPVANPAAFAHLRRTTPDGSDNADLNRVFPGHYTWLTEQLASVIAGEVLPMADALIDFHAGMWGAAMGSVIHGSDYSDPDVSAASRSLARAFGWPNIHEAKLMAAGLARSSMGYFGAILGRPSITPEIGGAGFDRSLEASWQEAKVKGTINVMKHLGILEGKPETPEKYLVWSKRWRVNPKKGGYLIPVVQPERLLSDVVKGELLGTIVSPYTFEEIERLEAPGRGVLLYCSRPYPVRPGGWAFGVIDLEDPNTRWE